MYFLVVFCKNGDITLDFLTILAKPFRINDLPKKFITSFLAFLTTLHRFLTTLHVKFRGSPRFPCKVVKFGNSVMCKVVKLGENIKDKLWIKKTKHV